MSLERREESRMLEELKNEDQWIIGKNLFWRLSGSAVRQRKRYPFSAPPPPVSGIHSQWRPRPVAPGLDLKRHTALLQLDRKITPQSSKAVSCKTPNDVYTGPQG